LAISKDDRGLLLDLHKIMSRQIKVVGELNAHIAGYVNRLPTSPSRYYGIDYEYTDESNKNKSDEGIRAADFVQSM
jgi:hypothetical protein